MMKPTTARWSLISRMEIVSLVKLTLSVGNARDASFNCPWLSTKHWSIVNQYLGSSNCESPLSRQYLIEQDVN